MHPQQQLSPSPLREVLAGQLAAKMGPLPKVQLPGDDSYNLPFIEDIASIIAESHIKRPDISPQLYRRDILPVYPVPGKRRFEPMTKEYFASWAERHIATYKTRHDRDGNPFDVCKPMTRDNAALCLASYDFAMHLPSIERTYPTPVPVIPEHGGPLRLASPGYDRDTGTFVFGADFEVDPSFIVPGDTLPSGRGYYDDRMTLNQAVRHLHQLFSQFPFSDWTDPFIPGEDSPFYDPDHPDKKIRLSRSLAVQIMAMLAVFAGGCVPQKASRLGFLMNANLQRSGKTLLVKMAVSPVYGGFKAQSWRKEEENMLKILDAETLAGSNYICFDNVRDVVASPPLEGFMTSPGWTGRILGMSKMFDTENNVVLYLTGNNTSLGADMQERLLIVDLYVETADRQDREVEIKPEDEIDDVWLSRPENRRLILSSLWAIVRHWDAAGRPLATGKPRKGFGTWCRILGGMVEFAGFGDALERPKNLDGCGDSESEDIRSLIQHACEGIRARHMTFAEITDLAWQHGLFPWLMHGKEDFDQDLGRVTLKLNESCNSKFGLLLKRNCSGERGTVHVFKSADHRSERRIRFYLKGKGRARRYNFEETNPA